MKNIKKLQKEETYKCEKNINNIVINVSLNNSHDNNNIRYY